MILLIPLLIAVVFFIEVLLLDWFFWALHDTEIMSQTMTLGESATVALPLFCIMAAGAAFGSRD